MTWHWSCCMTDAELYEAVVSHPGTQLQIAEEFNIKLWRVIALQAEERQRAKLRTLTSGKYDTRIRQWVK